MNLEEYAKQNPQEYAEKAAEANELGKMLRIIDGVLQLTDPPAPTPEQIRLKRNFLLQTSDHTQLADSPLSESARKAWAEYRQKLRDIPDQSGFPEEIVWPEKPE